MSKAATDKLQHRHEKTYLIELTDDGWISVRVEPGTGLGQDLMLEMFAEMQTVQAETRQKLLMMNGRNEKEPETNGSKWWPDEITCWNCSAGSGDAARIFDKIQGIR